MTERLSKISPASALGTLLRFPLQLIPKRSVVSVRAGLNRGMKWIVGSSIHGCWLGHYEQEKQGLLSRIVRPGMNVLDIGANAGFYTLAFSRLVGAGGHVWAFEPMANNVHNLIQHVALNAINNVIVVQAAVSESAGIISFAMAPSNSMGSLTQNETGYKIPTVSLDELVASNIIPVPDIVKMDVEGAESLVLRGASRILASHRTEWLIALHGVEQYRSCTEMLELAGYLVMDLGGRRLGQADNGVDEIHAIAGRRV